jgi:HD-like signal output (HDOD) protein
MIDRAAVARDVKALPTLPTVVAKLSALLNSDRSSISDFERALLPDPALTANVLRLANSAYFGAARKVSTAKQAITLLGTKRLFELATSASFLAVIPEFLPGYGLEARQFWMHCVAVGVFAEMLGKKVGRGVPDLAFTAGLLHDVGKLVIGSYIAKHTDEVTAKLGESKMSFIGAESAVLGGDPAEVGGEVADRWNLPSAIGVTARWHHQPARGPSGDLVVSLVHCADALAHMLGFGADLGGLARRVEPAALERLGLDLRSVEAVASESVDQVQELGKLLAEA